MDYKQALAFLDGHSSLEGSSNLLEPVGSMPVAGEVSQLSIEPINQLLSAVGDPQHAYRSVHIAGTNGKGSTARFMSSLLTESGLSVGTYTSPNVERVNERLAWAGVDISDDDFGRVIGLLAEVEKLVDGSFSRFEILTAAAFIWFAELGVDVAVVEVGLLGRFDATNVVDADVAVITNIGKDHTDGVGDWESKVASEKAGIIKPKSHVVLGTLMGRLKPIFEAEASAGLWEAGTDFEIESDFVALGGRLTTIRTPSTVHPDVFIPFHGSHQGENVAIALAAVEALVGRGADTELVSEALAKTELPARFEVLARNPTLILDCCHNPDGAQTARLTLDNEFARLGSWVLVLGLLQGRDPVEMLEAYDAADFDAVILCQPDWNRAFPVEQLLAAATGLNVKAEVVKDPVEAVNRAASVAGEEDLILVSGSFSVVGSVRAALRELAGEVANSEPHS